MKTSGIKSIGAVKPAAPLHYDTQRRRSSEKMEKYGNVLPTHICGAQMIEQDNGFYCPKCGVVVKKIIKFSRTYVAKGGDTLSQIAHKFGVSEADIAAWNNISSSDFIREGQVLEIPTKTIDNN